MEQIVREDMPEWTELVQPEKQILESDITFDDGGPDHHWTKSNRNYHVSYDKKNTVPEEFTYQKKHSSF